MNKYQQGYICIQTALNPVIIPVHPVLILTPDVGEEMKDFEMNKRSFNLRVPVDVKQPRWPTNAGLHMQIYHLLTTTECFSACVCRGVDTTRAHQTHLLVRQHVFSISQTFITAL